MGTNRILVVRLGAMGDILHALPAVTSLRASFPEAHIIWAIAPKWKELLEENPAVDEIVAFRRSNLRELMGSWRTLRALRPQLAIDFQGLLQSALVGKASRPVRFFGWDADHAREKLASRFYSSRISPRSPHVVDQNLELAAAAGARHAVVVVARDHAPPRDRRIAQTPRAEPQPRAAGRPTDATVVGGPGAGGVCAAQRGARRTGDVASEPARGGGKYCYRHCGGEWSGRSDHQSRLLRYCALSRAVGESRLSSFGCRSCSVLASAVCIQSSA